MARLVDRYHYVLQGMARLGRLSRPPRRPKAKLPAIARRVRRAVRRADPGYLLAAVRAELLKRGMTEQEITAGGLRIITTFDKKMQTAAEKAVEDNRPTVDAEGVHIGLAAVEPGTGAVSGHYGGQDYLKRPFSDATQAEFQPGSSFKAFTLAAMLKDDIVAARASTATPATTRTARRYNDVQPELRLGVNMLDATEKSINTAFVDITQTIGPEKVVDAAIAAGVPRDPKNLKPVPVVTLGVASETAAHDGERLRARSPPQGERAESHFVRDRHLAGGQDPATRSIDEDHADLRRRRHRRRHLRAGAGREPRHRDDRAGGRPSGRRARPARTRTRPPGSSATPRNCRRRSASTGWTPRANRESLDGVDGMSTFFGGDYRLDMWTDFMKLALVGQAGQGLRRSGRVGEWTADHGTARPSRRRHRARPPARASRRHRRGHADPDARTDRRSPNRPDGGADADTRTVGDDPSPDHLAAATRRHAGRRRGGRWHRLGLAR